MKKLKLNLQQLEGAEVLTRSQLKKVLGGNVKGSAHLDACKDGPCSVYDSSTGQTYQGNCGLTDLGGWYVCECQTVLGFYNPSGGTSHCYV